MFLYSTLFALVLFALLALFIWAKRRYPSKQTLNTLLQDVSQKVAITQYDAALKQLKPLIQNHPKNEGVIVLHAQILRGTRELTAARAVLDEAIRSHPDSLRLVYERGRTALEQGVNEQALQDFQACSRIMRDENAALDLATALARTDRLSEAWEAVEPYAMESSNGRLLALAGDCQFHNKNYQLALGFYQQAQHYGWSNQQILARTGYCLKEAGNLLEAERFFRSILAYDSSDLTATLGLGSCLESRGQFDRALMIYQGGQAWDDGDPLILRQAGLCAVYSKRYAFGELYLSEAVQRGAGSPQALAFLGLCFEAQEKWEQAEKVYLELTETYPDHVAGYRALAWLYGVGLTQSLSSEQGLMVADRALQMMPDAIGWELVSACEARAGNFTKAHSIHEHLTQQAKDKPTQRRRRQAMRALRKKVPLGASDLPREFVA